MIWDNWRLYNSTRHNPYLHLSLEHYHLYDDPLIEKSPVIIFYVNEPSVVMGNFQNPWREVNVAYCRQNNIHIVRRFSGGGCVYHDHGNLNIAIIAPRAQYDRNAFLQKICEHFMAQGVPMVVGEKNDLLIEGKKISGSAFREIKDRTLHHFTLLIQTDKIHLKNCLSVAEHSANFSTQALSSRRAGTTQLSQYLQQSFFEIKLNLVKKFFTGIECLDVEQDFKSDQWNTWDHVYAKTPSFSWRSGDLSLVSEKGKLLSLKSDGQTYHFSNPIVFNSKVSDLAPYISTECQQVLVENGFFI